MERIEQEDAFKCNAVLMINPKPETRAPNTVLVSRLRWQCRRGMKELDVLLERYLETRYDHADTRDRRIFEQLLALRDPELLAYLMGHSPPTDTETARVIDAIIKPD